MIDELLANDIEPYITLFHWDYPYELQRKGGWLNDDSVNWFAEYAAKVSELYSDRVKHFITVNEPQCFIGYGYLCGGDAPNLKVSYKEIFQICHNVLKAHGAAVIALLYTNLVREILVASHRTADIKVYGNESLRFSVYEGGKVYLLNTDFDHKIDVTIDYGTHKKNITLDACEFKAIDKDV